MQNKFKKIIQFGFILLIFFNIFSFNRTEAFDYKSLYLQIIFSFILLFWNFTFLKEKISLIKYYINFLVLIFFLMNLISFLFSPDELASKLQFYQVFIYTGIYFIFLTVFTNLKEVTHFINLLSFCFLLVSLYGIFQYFGYDFLRLTHKGVVFSTFINKNFLGGVLAINLPFCFVNLFLIKRILDKIPYFFGCLAVIYTLILTGSKGGILVGFTGMFFFFFLYFLTDIRDKKLRKKIFISGIVFMALIGIKFLLPFNTENILASLKGRFIYWQVALRMIKEHPFKSVGIGNFVLFAPDYKESLFYPEQFIRHSWNEFLELWAELGLFGLFIFIILFSSISFLILKIIFQPEKDKSVKIVSLAGLASLWSAILLNLGEINLRIVYLGIYFWISLAILAKLIEISLYKSPSLIIFSPFLRKILFIFIMLATFSLLNFAFTPLTMHRIHKKKVEFPPTVLKTINMENLEKEIENLEKKLSKNFSVALYNNLGNLYLLDGEADKAKECYQRALRINPFSSSANYNLGYAYFLEGKIKDAYEKFSFCLRLNPQDTDAYFMLKKNILY